MIPHFQCLRYGHGTLALVYIYALYHLQAKQQASEKAESFEVSRLKSEVRCLKKLLAESRVRELRSLETLRLAME